MKGNGKKILLAMSGGVDSSVAAALLLRQGYDVTGVFMCLGRAGPAGSDKSCCSPQDAADARRVAGKLGIDLHVLNLQEPFAEIIDYFVNEYANARTPNPCIYCNTLLKFGYLVKRADSLGMDYVATGHYARIVSSNGRAMIARGRAIAKDQSYALFGIAAEKLSRIMLPVGELEKKEQTREIARELELVVHDKPDSQEICFVEDDDYVSLLKQRVPQSLKGGRIINSAGETLGRHEGFARFTIGQRKGLRIAAAAALYVTHIDPQTGDVTVGTREESCSRFLRACRANWHERPTSQSFTATVQIRYNHCGCTGRVRLLEEDRFEVKFDEPVHAITPGQAAVIYNGDILLGGGWIE